jgi:methionine-rich copper-binding protein CopC
MHDTRTARAVPRLTAALLAGVLALATAVLTAAPASAHDVITGSDPADGSTVATAPSRVSVTFDEAPQTGFSTLTVVGPDGAHHEQGATASDGTVVSVGVGPLPAAGVYQIGYRIVSDDGHPVTGAVSFTLTTPSPAAGVAPAAASPQAAPAQHDHAQATQAAPPSPAASSSSDSTGVPVWLFVVLAVVVVGGAVALVLRRRT